VATFDYDLERRRFDLEETQRLERRLAGHLREIRTNQRFLQEVERRIRLRQIELLELSEHAGIA
jgi:hypothetical protein